MTRMVLQPGTIECDDAKFGAVARAVLEQGLTLRFKAMGCSMHPFVRDGEFLHVRSVGSHRVHVGDLVLFSRGETRFVVHRVLSRRRLHHQVAFVVKGDAVRQPDGLISEASILGKVVARERNGRRVDLTRPTWQVINAGIARLHPVWIWLLPAVRRLKSRLAPLVSR